MAKMSPGTAGFFSLLILALLAPIAGQEANDAAAIAKLAKLYDYAGLRGVRLKTTEGAAYFSAGKPLRMDFGSEYDLFPEDSAKYSFRDSLFTRQVFKNRPVDTGKISGVLDFKRLFLRPGNCEVTQDSLRPDIKRLTFASLLPGWFVLGFMPVVPIQAVSATGWLDAKSLEIRHLDIEVLTPGGSSDRETYSLDLDRYFSLQGRLLPGRIRYSMPGLAANLQDTSRSYLAQSSSRNPDRKKHIRELYASELKQGRPEEADKVKRAATRIETLKRRIGESLIAGSPYYEVRMETETKGRPGR